MSTEFLNIDDWEAFVTSWYVYTRQRRIPRCILALRKCDWYKICRYVRWEASYIFSAFCTTIYRIPARRGIKLLTDNFSVFAYRAGRACEEPKIIHYPRVCVGWTNRARRTNEPGELQILRSSLHTQGSNSNKLSPPLVPSGCYLFQHVHSITFPEHDRLQ